MRSGLKRFVFKVLATLAPNNGPKVVYYHDIHKDRPFTSMSTSLDLFKQHVSVAQRCGFSFVSTLPSNKNEIQVVLDDGFRGVWDVREELLQFGILPTICIICDFVGRPNYLSWDEIRELRDMGFQFAGHTWNHKSLTDCRTHQEMEEELVRPRIYLKDELGMDINSFCFPRGRFSHETIRACVQAGYENLYTSIPGIVREFPARYVDTLERRVLVPRNLVQFATPMEYKSILFGAASYFWRRYMHIHFVKEGTTERVLR